MGVMLLASKFQAFAPACSQSCDNGHKCIMTSPFTVYLKQSSTLTCSFYGCSDFGFASMFRTAIFALLVLMMIAFGSVSQARQPLAAQAGDQQAVRRAVQAGRLKPLRQIISAAQARYQGSVEEVELERDLRGRALYQLKIVGIDGGKREVYFDAVDGRDVTASFRPTALKPIVEVLRELTRLYEGRVMEIELEHWLDGREVYQVAMLTDQSRLREVIVDARTGKILQPESSRIAGLGELRPVMEVIDIVLSRYPGRVLEVEIEVDGQGRRYYEVELRLKDGRLLEVHADAISGALLRVGEMR